MPIDKAGFLTISATPLEPSSTEAWENAGFIKDLIRKLLAIHPHLVITIADGTLQAHNFQAFYPIKEYSHLSQAQAIEKALAIGQVIFDDLTLFLRSRPAIAERVTILRWADTDISKKSELVKSKLDDQDEQYDEGLATSIDVVVQARYKFLLAQANAEDQISEETVIAKSKEYFVDELKHAFTLLDGITIPGKDGVYKPEVVWYPGTFKAPHPILEAFKVGDSTIFHRIDLKGNVDDLIGKVAKKLDTLREKERTVEYISLLDETQDLQQYLFELNKQILLANDKPKQRGETQLITQNAHQFLQQTKMQLALLLEKLTQLIGHESNTAESPILKAVSSSAMILNTKTTLDNVQQLPQYLGSTPPPPPPPPTTTTMNFTQ